MSTTRPYSPGEWGPESDAEGVHGALAEAGPRVSGDAATGVREVREAAVGALGAPPVPDAPAAGPDLAAPQAAAAGAAEPAVRRLTLRDATGVVPLARDFARQALYAWGWMPAETADRRAAAEDVLLVVSELVTNACLHAEGPEELRIASDRKVLRVEVSDRGSGHPAPRTPHRAGRPGGHGMFIVQRLCLDWGVTRTPGLPGKTVWAELGTPG